MTEVTIYTTPNCPYCKKAKEFFKDEGIEYEEYNVAEDREKAEEMVKKSEQRGVPVITVGEGDEEEIIIGFNKEKLESVLDL